MKLAPSLIILVVALLLSPVSLTAQPIDFSEVSLLVRAREKDPVIIQEVSGRKLRQKLTAEQEKTLKRLGASESLVQTLRNTQFVLSSEEGTASDAKQPQRDAARAGEPMQDRVSDFSKPDVQIVQVAIGHPVNLSQWGGPNLEFAFEPPKRLNDGSPDAVMIDNVRSFRHTATYRGVHAYGWLPMRAAYASTMDHSFTRPIYIDWNNPTRIEGQPYNLYPVYAAGGVSLYYIGTSGNSVRLAVTSRWR